MLTNHGILPRASQWSRIALLCFSRFLCVAGDNYWEGGSMAESVRSEFAPTPVGPYSQAILSGSGDTLFTAGQIPIEASTGQIVQGGIREQTRCVLENIKAVLKAGGFGLNDVAKATVYMCDLGEFAAMNEVYQEFFSEPFPARSCVGVSALPKGVLVEIDVIAVREAGE